MLTLMLKSIHRYLHSSGVLPFLLWHGCRIDMDCIVCAALVADKGW